MQNTLDLMLSTNRAVSQDGRETEIHSNIGRDSVNKIRELIRTVGAQKTLEVGMASGVSTLAILGAHSGHHTAIDPNQTSDGPDGWQGVGLTAVRNSGLEDRFTLLKESSHLARLGLSVKVRNLSLYSLMDGTRSTTRSWTFSIRTCSCETVGF